MVYDFFLSNIELYYSYFNSIISIEVFFLQFFFLLILLYCYASNNIYYTLMYVFFLFFLFGIFLSFWQVDLFTGFLWLIELTIIFVFMLVLFYLNFKGSLGPFDKKINFLSKFSILIAYIYINIYYYYDTELTYVAEFNTLCIWEDYYESFKNNSMNDFFVLLSSYYFFNSFEFILIGFILFIGSIVCINIFKINKIDTNSNILEFISLFDFFKNVISYTFLRKQNLFNQNLTIPGLRIISKKN